MDEPVLEVLNGPTEGVGVVHGEPPQQHQRGRGVRARRVGLFQLDAMTLAEGAEVVRAPDLEPPRGLERVQNGLRRLGEAGRGA